MKILSLHPSSLGDVVQALPVLRLIKRHLPGSDLYWWIDSSLAPLLDGDPDLAGVELFERRRWAAPWRWLEVWRPSWLRVFRQPALGFLSLTSKPLRLHSLAWAL